MWRIFLRTNLGMFERRYFSKKTTRRIQMHIQAYRQQQNRTTTSVPVQCSFLSPGSRLTAGHLYCNLIFLFRILFVSISGILFFSLSGIFFFLLATTLRWRLPLLLWPLCLHSLLPGTWSWHGTGCRRHCRRVSALLLRCVASARNTIIPHGILHGTLVVCREPLDCTGTAKFALLLQDVPGYLHSPGAPLPNRHSSPHSPLALLLEGKPCPRQYPSVCNLYFLSFVFIVIILGRRLLLLISFSSFELRTLRTLTRQQLCLLLWRPRSWSLLRLLCLPVRREILGKVLYLSSGHDGMWIFAPHTSTGRQRFFFWLPQGNATWNHPG